MQTKIADLSVDEIKKLISESVREGVEDILEDFIALNSPEYLKSIKEGREEYRKGNVETLEQVFG